MEVVTPGVEPIILVSVSFVKEGKLARYDSETGRSFSDFDIKWFVVVLTSSVSCSAFLSVH